MKNSWIVIEIETQGAMVEIVSAILGEYGCSGTVIETVDLDTFDIPDGDLEPESIYVLEAYFPHMSEVDRLRNELEEAFSSMPVLQAGLPRILESRTVPIEAWSETWKQNFSTFRVGERLVVKPSWESNPARGEQAVIEIDPGMAFGTGTHGTTRLCLEVIAELFEAAIPPANMLDVGTGSGILALGAAALGCRSVVANDIDPVACQVARENLQRNGYQDQIAISERPLERLPGAFDLIVANILAEENVRLKHELYNHMKPHGWLVLSGILREKEGYVKAGFADLPLVFSPSRYQDDWVCLVARRQE